jgi:hypothetical protein
MIIDIILGYIVPFILLVAAGYLLKVYRSAEVVKWVGIAVRAAEQIFAHGENSEKFQYVSEWISKKFKISEADLKNIIESAVYELNRDTTK